MSKFYLFSCYTKKPVMRKLILLDEEIAAYEELCVNPPAMRLTLKSGIQYDVMAKFVGNSTQIIPISEGEAKQYDEVGATRS